MLIKRLFLICSLPAFIAGCAGFSGSQPPAPVYRGKPTVYREPELYPAVPETPKPDAKNSTDIVETRPLGESTPITAPIEIKPEPLPPEQGMLTPEQEQELATLEKGEEPLAGDEGKAPPQESTSPETSEPPPPQPEAFVPEPPPPPKPPAFEPLQSFSPLSPAVGALVIAANQNTAKGNWDSAATTIERAIRIEPRNATLYYKLAVLRLKESKPGLAEDLAKKSALYAGGDSQLKKHSWLLIARAREMQNNPDGAKEARAKADKL